MQNPNILLSHSCTTNILTVRNSTALRICHLRIFQTQVLGENKKHIQRGMAFLSDRWWLIGRGLYIK